MTCKVIDRECKNYPICAYRDNDYTLPEIFQVNCSFHCATEAENAPVSEEEQDGEETSAEEEKTDKKAEEIPSAPAEPEETIEEAVNSIADEIEAYEGSLQKYPAKKGRRPAIPDDVKKLVIEMYEVQMIKVPDIVKKTGLSKSSVYNIIKEHLGMETD